jgi:large subunit ribosomal protein L37Ae
MARTKKVGSAGRFGTRYGRKVKLKIAKLEKSRKFSCPECKKPVLKREAPGIWKCGKCGLKLAGKAYRPE